MEHMHSGRCIEFKQYSTSVDCKRTGPSAQAPVHLSERELGTQLHAQQGLSLTARENVLQIPCVLYKLVSCNCRWEGMWVRFVFANISVW